MAKSLRRLAEQGGHKVLKENRRSIHIERPDGKRDFIVSLVDEEDFVLRDPPSPWFVFLDGHDSRILLGPQAILYSSKIQDGPQLSLEDPSNQPIELVKSKDGLVTTRWPSFGELTFLADEDGLKIYTTFTQAVDEIRLPFKFTVKGNVDASSGSLVVSSGQASIIIGPPIVLKDEKQVAEGTWSVDGTSAILHVVTQNIKPPFVLDPTSIFYVATTDPFVRYVRQNPRSSGPPYTSRQSYSFNSGNDQWLIEDSLLGSTFQYSQLWARFDVSTLPSNATIQSAILTINPSTVVNNDGCRYYIDWGNPTLIYPWSESGYSHPPAGDAASGFGLTYDKDNNISLNNLGNIVRPYTYVKVIMYLGQSAFAGNYAAINPFSNSRFFLSITYTVTTDGSASVACVCSTSVNGLLQKPASASVACAVAQSATASITAGAEATVACLAAISVAGVSVRRGAASIVCAATSTGAGAFNITGQAKDIACIASVSATGVMIPGFRAVVSCLASASATAVVQVPGACAVVASAVATATGIGAVSGAASVPCVAVYSVTCTLRYSAIGIATCRAIGAGIGALLYGDRTEEELRTRLYLPAYPRTLEDVIRWIVELSNAFDRSNIEQAGKTGSQVTVGFLSQRPQASGSRSFYWAVDTGQMFFDDGQWRQV